MRTYCVGVHEYQMIRFWIYLEDRGFDDCIWGLRKLKELPGRVELPLLKGVRLWKEEYLGKSLVVHF